MLTTDQEPTKNKYTRSISCHKCKTKRDVQLRNIQLPGIKVERSLDIEVKTRQGLYQTLQERCLLCMWSISYEYCISWSTRMCSISPEERKKGVVCNRASLLHDNLGMYHAHLQLHSQTDNMQQYMHRILTDQWVHPVPRQLKTSRLYSLETSMTDGIVKKIWLQH